MKGYTSMEGRRSDLWMMLSAGGVGGAMLTYFFDSCSGMRRRARIQDQFISTLRRSREDLAVTWHDACHRGARRKFARALGVLLWALVTASLTGCVNIGGGDDANAKTSKTAEAAIYREVA